LAKIKLLKTKENDKDEKFADNSNTIVSAFMGENKLGVKKDSDLLLGKRAEMEARVDLSGNRRQGTNKRNQETPGLVSPKRTTF